MPIVLHVTVSLLDRSMRLDNAPSQSAITNAWRTATHWRVGNYTIMPDHIHFFCAPGIPDYPSVQKWVGFWKRLAGQNDSKLKCVFLDDCWDTQMRDLAHYEEKLSYARLNPVRKELVKEWEEWPFRGNIFDVEWH